MSQTNNREFSKGCNGYVHPGLYHFRAFPHLNLQHQLICPHVVMEGEFVDVLLAVAYMSNKKPIKIPVADSYVLKTSKSFKTF